MRPGFCWSSSLSLGMDEPFIDQGDFVTMGIGSARNDVKKGFCGVSASRRILAAGMETRGRGQHSSKAR